jgi:hypothetical protein
VTTTPLFDNLILTLARWYYHKQRADARQVRSRAEAHRNPPLLSDDFSEDWFSPRDGRELPRGEGKWHIAFINGYGRVLPAPHGEAGDILIEDGLLKLRVRHDANFEKKSAKWRKERPAAERYNNAYVVGLQGFMPTPRQAILVECRMKTSAGFHGSTGIWVQEEKTFDPSSGIMVKPFRSFGFSYLGESSDAYLRGLAIETVIGLSIQKKQIIEGVNVFDWHTYRMKWSWLDEETQQVAFAIDEREVGCLSLDAFGPAEVQLWADNYQIGKGLKIGYLNVPDVDETWYAGIKVEAVHMQP